MADPPEGYTVNQLPIDPNTGRPIITIAPLKVTAPTVTEGATATAGAPLTSQPLPEGYTINPTPPSEGVPQAFLDRVAAGSALQREMPKQFPLQAFGTGFAEGFGGEPLGWSPEHVQRFRDVGLYRDPATGRGGPVRLFNESIMQPIGALGDLLMRSASGVGYGLANSFGQLVENANGHLGNPEQARNEALNFVNYLLMRGDAEFTRPHDGPAGPHDQTIGPLPTRDDFRRGAIAIAPEKIVGAAVEVNGRIFRGAIHSDALDAAREALGAGLDPTRVINGFVTSDNRFLTRAEASKLVDETNLHSAHIPPQGISLPVDADKVATVEANLRTIWRDHGIHPAEAVHDAANDDFLKSRIMAKDWHTEESASPRQAVGAEVTRDFPDMATQPVHPPGALQSVVRKSIDRLMDMKNDLLMKVAPMAADANPVFRAAAKDAANAFRRNRWEYDRIDDFLFKTFTPEQRKRMWDASDEESVLRQEGKTSENMGIATLEPLERQAVENLNARAQSVWSDMRNLGMVKGEGLPFYTPRMIFNLATATEKDGSMALNGTAGRLRAKTANMLERKYLLAEDTEAAAKAKIGESATLVRDIRTTGLALRRLEDAIAVRQLLNEARAIGERLGEQVVAEGGQPIGSEHKWYTDSEHPAFKTWDTEYSNRGNHPPEEDHDGNLVFRQNQLYVRNDFAGPLKAILGERNGATYNAFMAFKSKTIGLIMNSPAIHNAVEFGRAFPAMPGKVGTLRVYFQGNAARKGFEYKGYARYVYDALTGNRVKVQGGAPDMLEAIDAGLVPIGRRFFNQDLSSIVEEPNLAPGRSLTAKILALVPGLWDEGAGEAVKRWIDRAGDVTHNTLLWDRIADLQMGLYVNFRNDMVGKGVDPLTAQRIAAHFANRFAGSLPQEAMSNMARKTANFLMFSRTFTLGNLGVMKDAFTGLPKDVIAQIERDYGEFDPKAADYAKSLARRKAAMVIASDIALFYITTALLQSGSNILRNDSDLSSEEQGYITRLYASLQRLEEHPADAITPLSIAGGLIGSAIGGPPGTVIGAGIGFGLDQLKHISPTAKNEPGKQDRVLTGYTKDGTGIYMRNVFGKIGEEFTGYQTNPADMFFKKMFGIPRTVVQILSNMNGFGQPLYDPNPNRPPKAMMAAILTSVEKMFASLIPESQVAAGYDLLLKGENDPTLDKLQLFGPVVGVTFSKGFPGGPMVGEEHGVLQQHQYDLEVAVPELRKQIQRGDTAGAMEKMKELNLPGWQVRSILRSSMDPSNRYSARTLRDIYRYSTPEQRARMEGYRQGYQPVQ